jgi:hypothetical protein
MGKDWATGLVTEREMEMELVKGWGSAMVRDWAKGKEKRSG